MPNPKISALPALIAALEENEYQYIHKISRLYTQNEKQKYLKILDDLRQSNPDPAPSSSAMRHYLWQIILKGLRCYQEQTSSKISIQIDKLKIQARILQQRGLLADAKTMLQKAQRLAATMESFVVWWELLETEKQIELQQNQLDRVKIIQQQQTQIQIQLLNEQHYVRYTETVFAHARQEHFFRSAEQAQVLQQSLFEGNIYFSNPDLATTFRARLCYWGTQIFYAKLKGDFEKAYQCNVESLQLWSKSPLQRQEQPQLYFNAICNFLNRATELKKTEEFAYWLEQLRKIQMPSLAQQVAKVERCALYLVYYVELAQQWEQLDAVVAEVEALLLPFQTQIRTGELFVIYYQITCLYIIKNNYKKALNWSWNLLHLPKHDAHLSMQRFARILEIIIHFGLGHWELLPALAQSIQRQLQNLGKLYSYERLFLKLAKEAPQKMGVYGQKNWLTKFQTTFELLKEKIYEKNAFLYFDILTWLESIAQKTTMVHLYTLK